MTHVLRRRDFLRTAAGGIGMAALQSLMARNTGLYQPKPSHFTGTARNVIFLYMEGAPSQIDLFDPKPALTKWHGQPLPPSMTQHLKFAFIKPNAKVLGCRRSFARYGQSGAELSDWLSAWKPIADDMCIVRSMHTDAFNHQPADMILLTGHMLSGRPTIGSWVLYGLGSEASDLPGFIVLSTGRNNMSQAAQWTSGFLPSSYQGVQFRRKGDPVLYLSNPPGVTQQQQRADFDLVAELDRHHQLRNGDPEIASRMASYEMAFRMQMSTPDLLDLSRESAATRAGYGLEQETTRAFGTNCLLARRLVEKGVRFVMVAHSSWDQHTDLDKELKKNCDITAGPVAALLLDLKQRGLLDSTLVVWAGEFGRTPLGDYRKEDEAGAGRDHHPSCFTIWAAGGGIRPGVTIGATDELGMTITQDPVHANDLQATILHCLGLDHTRLTYRHMGRDFRLTDVQGRVVQKMLA
ncbi:MAG: DUF1501 domain-containing protein [Acidobacteria bacterium]|nr:DUF1501 domain-containing protein [Acidobacteriota bacterium]